MPRPREGHDDRNIVQVQTNAIQIGRLKAHTPTLEADMRTLKESLAVVAVLTALFASTIAVPKKYQPEVNSSDVEVGDTNTLQETASDNREVAPRFGIQTNTISTTGATGLFPGLNPGPIKLDLGGLLLGAVLGLGAVLILPKLLHVVAPLGYDGYKRSEDGGDASGPGAAGLADMLARVDAALARHHVDSSACVQRAVCSAVRGAGARVREGDAGTLDSAVHALAQTDIVGMMLDGTAVKSAIDVGKRGGDCASSFGGCVATRDALMAALRGLASIGASNDSTASNTTSGGGDGN